MSLLDLFNKHKAICTDTRHLIPGSVFFALKGEHFNGNAFALKAIDEGCAYAVVDEAIGLNNQRIIRVPDVLKSLQDLAGEYRAQLSLPVIGITGSNGKTTTKELTASVLGFKHKCLATKGNLNNHIGVPLTLLSIRPEHAFAVVEMGANHPGEIAFLTDMVKPDLGILTNIGSAHLEGFGSLDGVMHTKKALYDYIERNKGKVLVNADDPLLMKLSEGIDRFLYGSTAVKGVQCLSYSAKPCLSISWKHQATGTSYKVQTQLFGSHNRHNVLAAICAGLEYGMNPADINKALSGYTPSDNRSQVIKQGGNLIIMDAYNANPASMKLVINEMTAIDHPNKLLILGDMLELGEGALDAHAEIANLALASGCDCLFAGTNFSKISIENARQFETPSECIHFLQSQSIRDALILVKGSRSMGMELVLPALR